jgi:drug/metabolite transporter (DMT)-like permease
VTHDLRTGALYLLLGEALLAIMGAMIKHLSDDLSTEQIVFFRNLFGLMVLIPLILQRGTAQLKTGTWHWHLTRAVVGLTAMYCYFWALGNMPLTEAFLVKLSSPFFMPLFAWWWLKEPASRFSLLALIIGFAGVAVILQPGGESAFTFAAMIGLLGAALAALAKVTIRRMSGSETGQSIVFYFALISSLISLPGAILSWQPIPSQSWIWLVAMGAVASGGQLAITRAYMIAPTGKVGVYVYSAVIYGALMGWWFWGEIPAWTTWAGALMIFAAGLLNLRGSKKSQAHKN